MKNYPRVPFNIPTPNTDSRERLILTIDPSALAFYFEAILPEVGKYTRAAMVSAIMRGVDAYTANKQRQLLEWVEKNVVGADEAEPDNTTILFPPTVRNNMRANQRNQLKNKKESL